MRLVLDSLIYQLQARGGISRIYNEILPRMCDLDSSLQIRLIADGKSLLQPLPVHPHIIQRMLLQSDLLSRFWYFGEHRTPQIMRVIRNSLFRWWIRGSKSQIWHSTYYTLPPDWWQGKSVVTVVDMIHELYPDLFTGLDNEYFREQKRQCVLGADAVICISETTRNDLYRIYGPNLPPIYVIPLSHADTFRVLESDGSSTSQHYLLYVGYRYHYKNFDALLETYAIWPRRNAVKLIVVGQPWTDIEKQKIAALGIANNVSLMVEISDKKLCQLYNRALAYISPSLYEGFGIPLLEAMACGCPVIASRIPSTVEVAGECPIYFDVEERQSLISALTMALEDGGQSERVEWGLKRAQLFSWDNTAELTLAVYRDLQTVQ